MVCEVLGRLRRPMPLQIVRRADHDVTSRHSQRQGDHVDRHEVGAADAEVETACNDVDQSTLCDDVDLNLGVGA